MGRKAEITCLFIDIGGVLLSDGWDRFARRRAAEVFGLDFGEMEGRPRLNFGTYEEGKMTFTEYLDRVVFHRKRPFSHGRFRRFMLGESKAHPEMIAWTARLKARYKLKVFAVSNEGRELNEYRIRRFGLGSIVDTFLSSCYVHVRKPDLDIYRLALDLSRAPARRVAYLENTPLFVEAAAELGIRGVLHQNLRSTRGQFASLGLPSGEGARP